MPAYINAYTYIHSLLICKITKFTSIHTCIQNICMYSYMNVHLSLCACIHINLQMNMNNVFATRTVYGKTNKQTNEQSLNGNEFRNTVGWLDTLMDGMNVRSSSYCFVNKLFKMCKRKRERERVITSLHVCAY